MRVALLEFDVQRSRKTLYRKWNPGNRFQRMRTPLGGQMSRDHEDEFPIFL
jgi:hypothetical protein